MFSKHFNVADPNKGIRLFENVIVMELQYIIISKVMVV